MEEDRHPRGNTQQRYTHEDVVDIEVADTVPTDVVGIHKADLEDMVTKYKVELEELPNW